MGLVFGSFESVCKTAALVVCPLLGPSGQGIEPTCYSRNVQIGSSILFQPSTSFVHIVAIIMTAIMIYHIRSKYTAVGRKEIVTFFWLYMIIELLAIFLDSGVIPTANTSYPWFAAAYTGFVAAAYSCLLVNGFVGFQFAEDGTPLSLWLLRSACIATFGIAFFVAIATFKSIASFSPTSTTALFVVCLLWPVLCVAVYTLLQLILVIRTLDDRWPIGDICFGVAFFTIAQVLLFAFSVQVCIAIKHYLDGLFFFTLCMLLAVMMVYKYWDSITREDLEFSVGSKAAVWDVKDPLLVPVAPLNGSAAMSSEFDEDAGSSNYTSDLKTAAYGGRYGQAAGGDAGYRQGGYRGYPPMADRY